MVAWPASGQLRLTWAWPVTAPSPSRLAWALQRMGLARQGTECAGGDGGGGVPEWATVQDGDAVWDGDGGAMGRD
jgi:hypothetical protein